MAMFGAPPLIGDLGTALEQAGQVNKPGRAGTFRITPQILEMFRVYTDTHPVPSPHRDALAYARFDDAQRLYRAVMTSAPAAAFYRLEDRKNFMQEASQANLRIANNFKNLVTLYGAPTNAGQVNAFFQHLKTTLQGKVPQTDADKIEIRAIDFLTTQNTNGLMTNNGGQIDGWFYWLNDDVKDMAEKRFYGVTDVAAARNAGTIYAPADHNWGVNAAWALAVTRKRIPIQVLSTFDAHNLERTHPTRNLFGALVSAENPSAFALEIAIAKKMNYALNFNADSSVTLTPNGPDPYVFTNGTLGNGVLPTKQRQLDIFRMSSLQQMAHNSLLQNHVQTICTGVNVNAKQELVNTLRFAHTQGELAPILNALSLAEHDTLRMTLSSPPFHNDANYDNLKVAARGVQLNAMAVDLEIKNQFGGDNLCNHIHGTSTFGNAMQKQDLIDTLWIIQQQGRLDPILGNLTLQEYDDLRNMFTTAPFNGAGYNPLKYAVMNARGNKIADMRQHIHDTCTGNIPLDQQRLIDALKVREQQGAVHHVLGILELQQHRELNHLLTTGPFNGVNYNNLKIAAKGFQLSAIASDLTARSQLDPNAFKDHIHAIATTGNNVEKFELMDTLLMMQQQGALMPILNQFSLRERRDLVFSLGMQPFRDNPNYNNLRAVAEAALKAEKMAIKHSISETCNNGSPYAKQQLMQSLKDMPTNQRRQILDILDADTKGSLERTLREPTFSSPEYNELKTAVTPPSTLRQFDSQRSASSGNRSSSVEKNSEVKKKHGPHNF